MCRNITYIGKYSFLQLQFLRYTIYGIRRLTTGRSYVGQTKNLKDRLRDHNTGHVKSTSREKPWELHAMEKVGSRKEAMYVEWKIKRSRGARLKWLERHTIGQEVAAQKENT